VTNTTRLSSSLRTRTAEESIQIATSLAASRGVSRVVDTTWLDRIGIPVYASIRPDGVVGSLCVHAGKGYTNAEAKIGAFMEAMEFSFATPGRNIADWKLTKPINIIASFKGRIKFPDFCPRMGAAQISPSDDIAAVEGTEILSGLGKVLVPAELVYHPFLDTPGIRLYGTTTNGLASGNTLAEAVVHGLAEVMERHVRSFDTLRDQSYLVDIDDAPPRLKEMAKRIHRAGLQCYVRYSENEFNLPLFSAYILEPDEHCSISMAAGFGFHPIGEVAAIRALAEAAQSRLSHIHGGRDDIIRRFDLINSLGREQELEYIRRARRLITDRKKRSNFTAVPTMLVTTIEQARECMFDALGRAGMNHVVQVPLTSDEYPFQVVKIIVPEAEVYEHELQRVGNRLINRTLELPHA